MCSLVAVNLHVLQCTSDEDETCRTVGRLYGVNTVHVFVLCTEGFVMARRGMQLNLCVGVYVRRLASELCQLKCVGFCVTWVSLPTAILNLKQPNN